eukprot:GABV01008967.1.p1 GENE.GABV01008967.1~~GABV01008967.1.p1  ORF type:complete len:233 (+),score=17.36 GABV01008967.1:2-700(+)
MEMCELNVGVLRLENRRDRFYVLLWQESGCEGQAQLIQDAGQALLWCTAEAASLPVQSHFLCPGCAMAAAKHLEKASLVSLGLSSTQPSAPRHWSAYEGICTIHVRSSERRRASHLPRIRGLTSNGASSRGIVNGKLRINLRFTPTQEEREVSSGGERFSPLSRKAVNALTKRLFVSFSESFFLYNSVLWRMNQQKQPCPRSRWMISLPHQGQSMILNGLNLFDFWVKADLA